MSSLIVSSLRLLPAITSVSTCGSLNACASTFELLTRSAHSSAVKKKGNKTPTRYRLKAEASKPSKSKSSSPSSFSSKKSSNSNRAPFGLKSQHQHISPSPSAKKISLKQKQEEKKQQRLRERKEQAEQQRHLELLQQKEERRKRQEEFDAERDKGMEELVAKAHKESRQEELVAEMKAKMRAQLRERKLKSLRKGRSGWKDEIEEVIQAGAETPPYNFQSTPGVGRKEHGRGQAWKNSTRSRPSLGLEKNVAEPAGPSFASWQISRKPPRSMSLSPSTASIISTLKSARARLYSSSAFKRPSWSDVSSPSTPSSSSSSHRPASRSPPPHSKPNIPIKAGGLPRLKEFYNPPPSLRATTTTSFAQRKGKLSLVSNSANSKTVSAFTSFTTPPLLSGLVSCLRGMLGPQANPTEIQRLSIGKVVTSSETLKVSEGGSGRDRYKEYILASETGSGKSIAYLLPLLQSLKISELRASPASSPTSDAALKREYNPRSIILTPTHELARQISGFAKTLSHEIKLRVVCASRANERTRKGAALKDWDPDVSMTPTSSSKAIEKEGEKISEGVTELDVQPLQSGSSTNLLEPTGRPVDVMVGTPMKMLEMVFGRGWDREDNRRKGRPEMSLGDVEWVVVDEADVLFDPDFNSQTRLLLSEISKACGEEVVFVKEDPTLSAECYPEAPDSQDNDGDASSVSASSPASPPSTTSAGATSTSSAYPFNLLLTTATIPPALSSYLERHHPSMVRLSSSGLHKLPRNLKIEKAEWSGGNKYADIEKRLKKVWMEDERRSAIELGTGFTAAEARTSFGVESDSDSGLGESGTGTELSKVIIFCNKSNKVEELGTYLESKGIKTVTLTSQIQARSVMEERGRQGEAVGADETDKEKENGDRKTSERRRGSNKHLAGFLRVRNGRNGSPREGEAKAERPASSSPRQLHPLVSKSSSTTTTTYQNPVSTSPHVLLTTSLLSRGLDFSPSVRHVFIVDEPRNVVDFLHRAGRTGRAGGEGVVVVFGKGGRNKGKDFGWRGGSKGGNVLQKLQE
ncbi:hypothetical protein GYMLUDRAFT_42953 [Collybiopsis luxurians FD-317 M1]|uniref:RNA helicase n=1 Tax=Collybiopsis luxurians FD-317 M1 TaxID=944289 RepID=A0A0D0CQN8_9AGAR|nr:hypothetical protein GYMLUDRAFT_42953 [Collybiopsis luxurians FD-317 M1]